MLQLKQNVHGIWQLSGTITVWRDGKSNSVSIRKSTRTKDRSQAEGIKRQIENEAAQRNITNQKPSPPFKIEAQRYLDAGGEARFLKRVIERYGHLSIEQFTQVQVDRIASELYPEAKKQTQIRQCYTPIIAVLTHCDAPQRIRKPKSKPAKRTYFFYPHQADRLIKRIAAGRYPNPWTPALVTFLFCQGPRVSEALALDGTDTDINYRLAIFRDSKNGEQRMVHLTPRTIASLQQVPNLGDPGALFLRYDGRPYQTTTGRTGKINDVWNRAVEDIGMDPKFYTPHTARHSWATWFYSATKDVVKLKSQGGWKSNEWERYVQLSNNEIGDEAVRLGFLDDPLVGYERNANIARFRQPQS